MTAQEANGIIAEFMGHKAKAITERIGIKIIQYPQYVSLDALVPVWEKLDLPNIYELDVRDPNQYAKGFGIRTYADLSYIQYEDHSQSIQEAAAIATAKAILELKQGEENE